MKAWSLVVSGVVAVLAVALLVAPAGASLERSGGSGQPAAAGIQQRLEAIPGMRVNGRSRAPGGAVFFRLSYRQPVDHDDPSRGHFRQRLTLWHTGTARPMVLGTTGYDLVAIPYRSEPGELLDANELHVEQRYFRPSRPEPARWRFLTIRQAAADHHRLVTALRELYGGAWISTGASKGGMASVYHRRFYPDDVDGTVAYVAPNDVHNRRDVYDEFIQTAGTDRACNRRLRVLQKRLLSHRPAQVRWLRRQHRAAGLSVDRTLGTVSRAFEAAVLDTPFAFWQYTGQRGCRRVPGRAAPLRELRAFVDRIADWDYYSDQSLRPFEAYYQQASRQLGWPTVSHARHLRGLLDFREANSAINATPRRIRPRHFDRGAMADIDRWVRQMGSQLLFVYGEVDPWSAEPFSLGSGTADSAVLWEPRGTHSASIAGLRPRDRRSALEMLSRWAGVPARARPGTPEPMATCPGRVPSSSASSATACR